MSIIRICYRDIMYERDTEILYLYFVSGMRLIKPDHPFCVCVTTGIMIKKVGGFWEHFMLVPQYG